MLRLCTPERCLQFLTRVENVLRNWPPKTWTRTTVQEKLQAATTADQQIGLAEVGPGTVVEKHTPLSSVLLHRESEGRAYSALPKKAQRALSHEWTVTTADANVQIRRKSIDCGRLVLHRSCGLVAWLLVGDLWRALQVQSVSGRRSPRAAGPHPSLCLLDLAFGIHRSVTGHQSQDLASRFLLAHVSVCKEPWTCAL